MKITNIALNKLVPSNANVRRTGSVTGIDELAASIEAHGLLQNLQTREGKGGKFEVVAGGRRLAALKQLAKQKKIAKDAPIPCHVLDEEDASEISLAENVVRLPMHPADQYDAFKALADSGKGPEEIAARFGCTPVVVKQRLKLACVSPRLLDAYRAEEMTLDQLMAFTVSEDHAAQEAAWFEQPEWNRDPSAIRRVLTSMHIEATDPLAVFVGLKAYRGAGGGIMRDLFDAEHEGYLTDIGLLTRLVEKKLEAESKKTRSEGWKWVEIEPEIDHARLRAMTRLEAEELPIPEERQAECERITAEYEALSEQHGEYPPEGIAERLQSLSDRIDELSTPESVWNEADKARAGVVIGIDRAGRLAAIRGLVRAEDEAEAEPRSEEEAHSPMREPKLLSDKLVEDLTARRTAAMRAVLAGNADVALTATVHAMALARFYGHADRSTCLSLHFQSPSLERSAEGIAEDKAAQMLDECKRVWRERLPQDPAALWDWLSGQSMATRLDLLAFCAACSVDAVKRPHNRDTGARFVHADQLAAAIKLDMAQWWEPTAAKYLARVSKPRILEAVSEAVSASAAENVGTMKKAALVAEAEHRLAGKGWLPQILRLPLFTRPDDENGMLREAAE